MNSYSDTVPHSAPAAEDYSPGRRRSRRAIVLILLCCAMLWAISVLIPVAVRHTRIKTRLTAGISSALGRPVQVASYDFSLWGGPTVEAQAVSVGEDPRFGTEYFIRAESMNLRLRWTSLLKGRFEPVRILLIRPTLNIVRNAKGEWNLAEWLPKPNPAPPTYAATSISLPRSQGPRFTRIEVEDGRIDFKRSYDKLPFALVGVSGAAETDNSGRWNMDLTAAPWRAAVDLQDVGSLHAFGYSGGTSSRLWPAGLTITWTGSSLPDVLRLIRGDDWGTRGEFAASIDAATHSDDGAWTLNARVQIDQIHRSDLALRADNPAVNLYAKANWKASDAVFTLDDVRFEAPSSNGRFSLRIVPRPSSYPGAPPSSQLQWSLAAAEVDASDVLAWVRAFHRGVAENVSAGGTIEAQGSGENWPPQVMNGEASAAGIALSAPGLRRPVRLGPVDVHFDHGAFSFSSSKISFGSPDSAFLAESVAKTGRTALSSTHVSGGVTDARTLVSAARSLGWDFAHGWDIVGPVQIDLRWPGPGFPWRAHPIGFAEWGVGPGVTSLRVPFLNLPITEIKARADFNSLTRHVTLSSAQAFGARWTGTMDSTSAAPDWRFSLSADRISASDLDRWLNPRWRESFLDRMLPFLNSRTTTAQAGPADLRGSGHLDVAQFAIGTLKMNHLSGNLIFNGRYLSLDSASAQLASGTLSGSFTADLEPKPTYKADFDFSHVDLSTLTDQSPILADLFDGSASGTVSLATHGSARSELFAALVCSGNAHITSAQLRTIDLLASLSDAKFDPGSSRFATADAEFLCSHQTVQIQNLALSSPQGEVRGLGSVDFARTLDLTLVAPGSSATAALPAFRLTGPLSAPEVSVGATSPHRAR